MKMVDMFSRVIGLHSIKDTNLTVVSCNSAFLEYAGAKNHDAVLGRTDYDFPWYEYADLYSAHESNALSGNNYSVIIPAKIHTGDELLFLHTKIQRKDNNIITGVICRAIEIINPSTKELIQILKRTQPFTKYNCYSTSENTFSLTKKQKEILFYLTRGKSTKVIATIMDLSIRTIEHYIDHLKRKFNCHTKGELVGFAFDSGLTEILPSDTAENILRKLLL